MTLGDLRVRLDTQVPLDKFRLLRIFPKYAYDKDGNRTDTITGYSYRVGDPIHFDQMNVQVDGNIAKDVEAEFKANPKSTYVVFENAICTVSVRDDKASLKITAGSVSLSK